MNIVMLIIGALDFAYGFYKKTKGDWLEGRLENIIEMYEKLNDREDLNSPEAQELARALIRAFQAIRGHDAEGLDIEASIGRLITYLKP